MAAGLDTLPPGLFSYGGHAMSSLNRCRKSGSGWTAQRLKHDDETPGYRVRETIRACRRGWSITPLNGKVPVLPGWQNAPRPTIAQAVAWTRAGNIGLRTGRISGLVVIDLDTAKGADRDRLELPSTVTVITGSGGLHFYFRHPGGKIRNSVGRLAPHIDVRGDGGQVVFVGSIHPGTGRTYRWADGASPDERPLADIPDALLARLRGGHREHFANSANIANAISPSKLLGGGASPYGSAALAREVLAVQSAPQGTRNDTLNRAAFCLGQLVATGHLLQQEVFLRLEGAAEECGLSTSEAARTIRSGLTAGLMEPRS